MCDMDKEMFAFYRNALTNGLCQEYKGTWQACGNDIGKLAGLAMQQQSIPFFATYCYNGDGLTKEYILEHAKKYINNNSTLYDCDGVKGYSYKWYVDYHHRVRIHDDVLHFMWCDISQCIVGVHICPTIYLSNKTTLDISTSGYNSLRIYLFDESQVFLSDIDETSDVTIFKYSDDCMVYQGKFCLGKVKEHRKELRLS